MVPTILHQIVGPKADAVVKYCLASWQSLLGDEFDIVIWDDALLAAFITKEYPFALNAFLTARNHAEAADIARYLLVYHTGGYYMDWDVQLLDKKAFIDLIDRTPKGFLIIDPANGSIAAEAFSAARNETYLLRLVENIVGIYERNERGRYTTPFFSGPFRMQIVLKEHTTGQSIIPVKEVFAYDYSEIREMPEREITQPMVHYWLHTWILTSSKTTEPQD
jgi:mannosyltransferase OCH1-like enzyme